MKRVLVLAVVVGALVAAAQASSAIQVVKQGTVTLGNNQTLDLETGAVVGGSTAFVWEVFGTTKRLVISTAAGFANIGVKDFGPILSPQLRELSYNTGILHAAGGASNPLVTNDVFAVKTSAGNFAKLKVRAIGATTIQLDYVTYPPPFTLKIEKAGTGSGRVTTSPAGIDCGTKCLAHFARGDSVDVTATPDAGSAFTGYDFSCKGTAPCEIPMNDNRSLKVVFDIALVAITVNKIGNGTVTGNPAGIACGATCTANYQSGAEVTLTGAPAAGWQIFGWTGGCTAAGSTCALKPTAASTVNAVFGFARLQRAAAQARWTRSVLAGKLDVGGELSAGADVTFTLTRGKGRRARTFLQRQTSLAAGAFTRSLVLPRSLLPGGYVLALGGTMAGVPIPRQTVPVTLVSPPEGVVARALISAARKGKGARTLPVSTRRMFARFIFAPGALPKERLRAEWIDPAGNAVGATPTRRRQVVETFVAFPASFPAARKRGVWRCVLKAGDTVVKQVSVRLV